MGGRGAASGMSIDKYGKPKNPYGSEFRVIYQAGNIKFVVSNSGSAKTPMETMTNGRVYATVNDKNEVKAITYYDKNNKRFKQIDVTGRLHTIDGSAAIPHTHLGYVHEERGTRNLTTKEKKMVERVLKTWHYYKYR